MNPLTGGADDADDLFIDLIIGWSDADNRVRAMVHVHDNDLIVDKNPTCAFRDDNCEVHFDPDNGGGGPYSAPADQDLQPAYQMCLSFSEQFPRVQMYNGALGNFEQDALDFWWTHSGDFVSAGHVNQGQDTTTSSALSSLIRSQSAVVPMPARASRWPQSSRSVCRFRLTTLTSA